MPPLQQIFKRKLDQCFLLKVSILFFLCKNKLKTIHIVMMFTAALVTIAKIYEKAKYPANIPKAELGGDDGTVGRGLLGKNCQNVACGCMSPHYWYVRPAQSFQDKSKKIVFFFLSKWWIFIKLTLSIQHFGKGCRPNIIQWQTKGLLKPKPLFLEKML